MKLISNAWSICFLKSGFYYYSYSVLKFYFRELHKKEFIFLGYCEKK